MNRAFQEVTALYRHVERLTHAQRVTRMYRKALRTLDSWAIDRELFNDEATKIRARFDAAKSLDPADGRTVRLMREAEEELVSWTHPDRYVNPYMPGGSKFMRNPPLPLKALYPDGIPAEVNIAPVDIHGIQVPMSAFPQGRGTVLIDVYKKSAME